MTAGAAALPALTGLRIVAALLVLGYHLAEVPELRARPDWLAQLFGWGNLGVDIFFVLSGFILHHVYRAAFAPGLRARAWRDFLVKRLARIYPVHLVTLALMLLLYVAALVLFDRAPQDPDVFRPAAVLHALALTHGWFGIDTPNIPSWSISAEWAAYLAFPALCAALARLPRAACWAVAAAALAAAQLWAREHGVGHALAMIAPEFALGMVTRELLARGLPPPPGAWLGTTALAAHIALLMALHEPLMGVHVALFALLIAALAQPGDLLGRALGWGPVVYLGEISYALYMVQSWALAVVRNLHRLVVGGDPEPALWYLLGTAASLAAAIALHHLVERPARARINAWIGP